MDDMQIIDLRGRRRSLKIKPIDWTKKSRSQFQKDCKDLLRIHWDGDVVGEEVAVPGTMMKMDFVNLSKKIILEVDGQAHRKFNKFFHNNNIHNFISSLKRDESKEKFAKLNGFELVRITSMADIHRYLALI